MEHSVEMQSGSGNAGSQPTKDQTETEVRIPPKIDLKSVLAGFSSGKSKAPPPPVTSSFNDVTSSLGSTSTSASTKSPPPTPPTTIATTTPLLSSSSSSTATTTTTSTNTNATTTAPATTVSSISASNGPEDKKGGQNSEGEAQTEGQDEPFVMTPAYERLAKLLARKREHAAAVAAPVTASVSGEGVVEGDGDTLPQQSHWSKLRTTVQIASVVKQRSKRRFHHHRQDSFLRKFSTRHNTNMDQDSDSEDNEAVTQEMEKEVEQKRLYRYVISPEGTFMMYWLLILTLAVLYNLWTCIAREAFREIQLEYTSFWISFDVVCDLIYLADIAVQFRTGYLEQGLLVYNSKKLAKNYYTSADFKLDVFCLLPLDLLQLTLGWHPILRFPRFLKIHRTFRCMYMLESRTPYPNLFRVANLTHILFLGAHWFAAFFYLISEAENFVGAWTYPKPVGEFAGVTRKYLYSLFWSTLTLTTIGDLPPPTTNWEFVFVIFSYLIGVFIFATIVGQVGNVITNRNASRQEFEKLLDGAKFYMQSHNVPKELQKRVQRWYDYVWSRGRLNGSLDIGSLGMLPDKLKTELALNVNLDTLKKVTIFQECQPEFLHDLVLKMKAHIFTPGDLICRRGEVAREMFIIADGVVEILSDRGTVLTSMSSGDFFGEIGILNLHGGINRRTADVRSLGYSELFVLSREDVLAALKDQPDAEAILVGYAQERLRDLREYRASGTVSPVMSKGRINRYHYQRTGTKETSECYRHAIPNEYLGRKKPDMHIIREYGEKRLKEIEAHNKKNSDPTPTPSPGSTPKTITMSTTSQNSLQVGPVKTNKPLKMSNLDKPSLQEKESPKSKTASISKRLRDLPLGRSIAIATSNSGNEGRFHRLWRNNWTRMFSGRKEESPEGESRNVRGPGTRSGEKRRKSSSNSSSSPEARTRKHGVTFAHDSDGGGKGGVSSGGITGEVQSTSGRSTVNSNRKTLSNRLSSIMSHHKVSHGARYSAVRPDTSDSDSAHTDSASQPLTKPADISKKDCPMADRRVGGFAGLLSAAGFRRPPTAKTSESTGSTTQPVPHVSLTVSSLHSSKEDLRQAPPCDVIVVETADPTAMGQTTSKQIPLSATILMEDVDDENDDEDDDISSSEITTCWSQQKQPQQLQYSTYTKTNTNTANFNALSNIHSSVAGSVPSLSSSISTIRGPLPSLPSSSSVHTFGPSSRGSSSGIFPNPARSATTHSFTSSSLYSGTASGSGGSMVTSRPPITQSYSFSSSSSPYCYPSGSGGGVGNGSTCYSSTPNVHHVASSSGLTTPVVTTTTTTAKTTSMTSTTMTTSATSGTMPPPAPFSGNKFSLLAGRRRGPQQTSGLRSCSLDEYRTSTSSSPEIQTSSSFWSPTPAAPPPSYYSSYSVSSSPMHPNRWIPGSGATHAPPLGLAARSSTNTSIENGALVGQTASSPNEAGGKSRKEPNTPDRHWQANQVIKDIQKVLDEKINELQHVYQDSLEQYSVHIRHQDDRIRELERQLKTVQVKKTMTDILPLNVGAFVYPAWTRNSPVRLWKTQ